LSHVDYELALQSIDFAENPGACSPP